MNSKKHNQEKKCECFVVMPIGGKRNDTNKTFDEIYRYLIKTTVEGKNLRCVRADESSTPGSIIEDIRTHLANSAIVIADITGQNPNVLYEVGFRHGAKGRTILLAQNMADVPFDLREHRVVIYDVTSPKGYHEAKKAIESHLEELLEGTQLKM